MLIHLPGEAIVIKTDDSESYHAIKKAFSNTHTFHTTFKIRNDGTCYFMTLKDNVSKIDDWLWNNEKMELCINDES